MLTIKEWQLKYKSGYFESSDIKKIAEAGWYDWFCSCDELNIKNEQNGKWILKLCDSTKISIDKNGIIFSNKFRLDGVYYDSVKIVDIEKDMDLFLIDIYTENNNINYKLYDIKKYYKKVIETKSIDSIISFLNK